MYLHQKYSLCRGSLSAELVSPLRSTPVPVCRLRRAQRRGARAARAAMATPLPKSRRPVLLSKVEGHTDEINMVLLVPGEDAVISGSDDK